MEPEGPFVQEDWGEMLLWRFTQAVPGTQACFSSRPGGLSPAPYASLNLGFHVGDDPERVAGNRALLCSSLGIDPASVTSPRQRHTSIISVLENSDEIGAGSIGEESVFDPCDGLITSMPGAPLLLHFADCVPVVLTALTEDEKPLVGVVHAGRQGLMDGVVRNAVAALKENHGVVPGSTTAAIGPCIGPCCYEVDEETAVEFVKRFGPKRANGRYLDLGSAVADELADSGVWRVNIDRLEICTSCNNHFYSYRRDGVTGRHGAIAWIEE